MPFRKRTRTSSLEGVPGTVWRVTWEASPSVGVGTTVADVAFVSNSNTNTNPGRWPVFTFRDNLESVLTLDHSGKELHIAGIDMIYRGNGIPLVEFIRRTSTVAPFAVYAAGVTTMQFDLWHNLTPTGATVDIQKIQNDGTVIRSTADIVVDGSIVNPAGWTRILNTDGDIRSGSDIYSAVISGCLDAGDVDAPLPAKPAAKAPR